MGSFLSEVRESASGKGLFATFDIPAGVVVEGFEGKQMRYDEVPENRIRYVLVLGGGLCIDPETDGQFANHSCDPNCVMGDDRMLRTIRPVKKGEELTYCYNPLYEEEDPSDFHWDPRWDFDCQCGAPGCQGRIDRYVRPRGDGPR